MIGIIEYGSGNIQAIKNVFNRLKIPTFVISKPDDLKLATRLILPGVGAFDEAMSKLSQSGLRSCLDHAVLVKKIPVMGICIGMQIMGDRSDEGKLDGLGWIPGEVRRFDVSNIKSLPKLPHMGWNNVNLKENSIFKDIDMKTGFYFLHSYYFKARSAHNVIGTSTYELKFDCAVSHNNIYGFQFHPEKSHRNGIQLFKNFSEVAAC